MKKQTEYIIFPPGYNLPIAHYNTMKQVRKMLKRNSDKWVLVTKWIQTKSHKYSSSCWAKYCKYKEECV